MNVAEIRALLTQRIKDTPGEHLPALVKAIRDLDDPPDFEARLKSLEARTTLLESVKNFR